MTSRNQQTQPASRLDFASLRKRLAELGLEASFCQGDQVTGLSPAGCFCSRVCQLANHCHTFLNTLAADSLGNRELRWRSCLPGAFTVVAHCQGSLQGPVVLACFVTKSLAQAPSARELLARHCLDEREILKPACRQAVRSEKDLPLLHEMLTAIVQDWYSRGLERIEEIESLSRSLADSYEELSFIYRLHNTMSISAEPDQYFQALVDELRELLAVKAVRVILLPDALPADNRRELIIASGQLAPAVQEALDRFDLPNLAQAGAAIHRPATAATMHPAVEQDLSQILLVPIRHSDRPFGALAALGTVDGRQFNNIDLTRLACAANSAAVFLENLRLYRSMRRLFLGSLRALTSSIDAKDPYTCGHSERVALIGKAVAQQMNLPPVEVERVYLCGLLHDIGKIGVPEATLRKPGRLTDEELEDVRLHPIIGSQIISSIKEMDQVVPGVLHHHERWDGKGYPAGLAGEQIPLSARILCVADTLDAMTSDRPYRGRMAIESAREEIIAQAGAQFDPQVVQALLQLDVIKLLSQSTQNIKAFSPQKADPPLEPVLAGVTQP